MCRARQLDESDLMTLDTAGLLSVFRDLCLFLTMNIRILGVDLSTSFGMTDRWLAHAPQMYCFLPLLHCIVS